MSLTGLPVATQVFSPCATVNPLKKLHLMVSLPPTHCRVHWSWSPESLSTCLIHRVFFSQAIQTSGSQGLKPCRASSGMLSCSLSTPSLSWLLSIYPSDCAQKDPSLFPMTERVLNSAQAPCMLPLQPWRGWWFVCLILSVAWCRVDSERRACKTFPSKEAWIQAQIVANLLCTTLISLSNCAGFLNC